MNIIDILILAVLGISLVFGMYRGFISGVNSFTLMAIPFFMISGSIMNQGGLSKRIIQFCSSLFSWLRGGVGIEDHDRIRVHLKRARGHH